MVEDVGLLGGFEERVAGDVVGVFRVEEGEFEEYVEPDGEFDGVEGCGGVVVFVVGGVVGV